MSKLRPPVRAGSFYPASPVELRQTIARYLAYVGPSALTGDLLGLICPHAGYVYSGETAAHAYALAQSAVEQAGQFDLVVVLSPAHFMGAGRFSISDASAYQTPLGTIEIDQQAVEALGHQLRIHRVGFDGEHAIEVQLPFLQSTIGEFALLPVMIGDATLEAGEELGHALHDIVAGKRALIVASSDMHHINNYDQVTHRDHAVIEALASMDLLRVKQVLSPRDCTVCGRVAIYAMLGATMAAGADHVEILHYTNSGDVTGRRRPGEYTVGYLAAAVLRET